MTSLRLRSPGSGSLPRRRLLTALLLLILLLAAGCAPGQSIKSESDSGRAVTLQLSTWGNDSRLKLTQQAVDAFTAANPDIEVTIQNNDWSAYWDKLATMTAGNNSPDVIRTSPTSPHMAPETLCSTWAR